MGLSPISISHSTSSILMLTPPTDRELEALKVLWDRREATVRWRLSKARDLFRELWERRQQDPPPPSESSGL